MSPADLADYADPFITGNSFSETEFTTIKKSALFAKSAGKTSPVDLIVKNNL